MRIAARRGRGATRVALDPPFAAAWDPVPRTRSEAALVIVRADGRHGGLRERRRAARRGAARAAARRPRPAPHRGRARAVRDGRLPRRAAVDRRGGGLGPRRPAAGRAAVAAARRALGAPARLRVERRAGRAGGAGAARRGAARRGVRAVKLRFHHADWRDDVAVVEAVREAVGLDVELMVDANHGWRMAGDRTPPWDVADRAAVRAGAGAARRLLARGAAADRRPRRLRAPAAAGTSLRIAAGEMVRGLHEARDLVLRGGVDVIQPDVVLAGGIGGCRADRRRWPTCAAARSPRTPGRTASGSSPTCTSRCAVSTCPFVEVPLRPAGLDAGAARLAARRRPRWRSPPTARSPRRRARASASRPTSTRWRRTASDEVASTTRRAPGARPRSRP